MQAKNPRAGRPRSPTVLPHLQVCNEASRILLFVLWGWVDPDEAVVAQDDGRPTWQVMEMRLLPLDQGWGHLHQDPLAQLMETERRQSCRAPGPELQRVSLHPSIQLFPDPNAVYKPLSTICWAEVQDGQKLM